MLVITLLLISLLQHLQYRKHQAGLLVMHLRAWKQHVIQRWAACRSVQGHTHVCHSCCCPSERSCPCCWAGPRRALERCRSCCSTARTRQAPSMRLMRAAPPKVNPRPSMAKSGDPISIMSHLFGLHEAHQSPDHDDTMQRHRVTYCLGHLSWSCRDHSAAKQAVDWRPVARHKAVWPACRSRLDCRGQFQGIVVSQGGVCDQYACQASHQVLRLTCL